MSFISNVKDEVLSRYTSDLKGLSYSVVQIPLTGRLAKISINKVNSPGRHLKKLSLKPILKVAEEVFLTEIEFFQVTMKCVKNGKFVVHT